jgi:hypothetical protein
MPTLQELLDYTNSQQRGIDINSMLNPVTYNQQMMRQGVKARANMSAPTSVMDPRYDEWRRNMDDAEKFMFATDVASNLIPFAGPAAKGAIAAGKAVGRYAEPKIAEAVESYMAGSGLRPSIYMPTRPKMPPQVGTRYQTQDVGGLLPEKPFKIEDYEGASIGVFPWDNSGRNKLITMISDEALNNPVLTHGGQPYARDILHQQQNIAGASSPEIVKRIADRVEQARIENLRQGGSGIILQTPITMGKFSENYSVMPTEILFNLFDKKNPSKSKINEINKALQSEFPTFKGIETPEGRIQLIHGDDSIGAPGQLRKKFVNSMYTEGNEKYFGFNRQDISNAITEPSLIDVPRGYGLNTVISHGIDPLKITPSINKSYRSDFSGQYVGKLGNVPVKEILHGPYSKIYKEYSGAVDVKGRPFSQQRINDAAIGALEKRKEGVFQKIDQQMIDRIYGYLGK